MLVYFSHYNILSTLIIWILIYSTKQRLWPTVQCSLSCLTLWTQSNFFYYVIDCYLFWIFMNFLVVLLICVWYCCYCCCWCLPLLLFFCVFYFWGKALQLVTLNVKCTCCELRSPASLRERVGACVCVCVRRLSTELPNWQRDVWVIHAI